MPQVGLPTLVSPGCTDLPLLCVLYCWGVVVWLQRHHCRPTGCKFNSLFVFREAQILSFRGKCSRGYMHSCIWKCGCCYLEPGMVMLIVAHPIVKFPTSSNDPPSIILFPCFLALFRTAICTVPLFSHIMHDYHISGRRLNHGKLCRAYLVYVCR